MQWESDLAVVWLASGDKPYLAQFADRADPGTSSYFYYALDGLDFIYREWPKRVGKEPWAYCRDEQRLYSPQDLRELESSWREQFQAERRRSSASAEQRNASP